MPEEQKPTAIQKAPPQPPKRVEAKPGTVKKKPFWKRMKEALFVETARDVGAYLWHDVMLPAIKKLVADSATNAINMAVYGENHPRYNGQQTHVANSSIYSGRAASQRNGYYNRTNRYQNILEGCLFSYKETAIEIIHEAMDQIARYGSVSVETFSQILPPELAFATVHTDRDFGWTSLNENCVIAVPGGWTIDLPPARPLYN